MIELGGSPVDLSLVAVGNAIGLVGAVLIGGVVADRCRSAASSSWSRSCGRCASVLRPHPRSPAMCRSRHLAIIGFALGAADGFFYPAYSRVVAGHPRRRRQLLAANGIEGVLRPTVMQAAGPAVASLLIAIDSPGLAFLVIGVLQFGAR